MSGFPLDSSAIFKHYERKSLIIPDREAETSAQWMRHHPDITVVSRDRGSEYAKAAMLGAPQATQCADRFHIVKNLTEATQLILARWEARNRGGKQKERALSKFINQTGHLSRRVARHPSQPMWRKRGWPDERGVTRAISR